MSEGFPDAAIKLTQPGRILIFHGKDSHGHAILIELQGKMSKPVKTQQVFTPTTLLVGYAQDPDHPDVFALPKGAF